MGLAGITPGTIRSRLLLVVLAALLPVTILGARQSLLAYRHDIQAADEHLRATAWAIANSERDPFILARQVLVYSGDQPAVRDITPQCNDTLRAVREAADGIVNIVRTDAQGKAQCSVLPFTPGMDLSHNRWWRDSLGKTGIAVAQPEIGAISGRPVLILIRPLQDRQGRFTGTVSASVDLGKLYQSLQGDLAGKSGMLIVASRSGFPILQVPVQRFRSLPDVAGATQQPAVALASDGKDWAFATAPLFGDDVYLAYAEQRGSLISQPFTEARAALALQLLTLLLTSLAIWFGTRHLILQWLDSLQRLAARFTRGDFTDPESYAGAPYEIAQLADQLHDMAAAIGAHEKELRDALRVETALTREVHHRVKNNLQIITSLLSLQADRISDPAARSALGLARTRIGTLGLIHRLLYQEKTGAEQGMVYLPQLFAELCIQLRAANIGRRGINLECSASDGTISVDQAVPLTLFVVEAVSNAFQHAFAGGRTGNVWAELLVDGDEAALNVRDDGNGFEEAGGNPKMGLDLMQAFALQLGGTMNIAQSKSGTSVTLAFALAHPETLAQQEQSGRTTS